LRAGTKTGERACCAPVPDPHSPCSVWRQPALTDWSTTYPSRALGCMELTLTPLELMDRLAALIPPPRLHRHRYHGVLAPNAPLRAALTALAREPAATPAQSAVAEPVGGEQHRRSPARTL
jgi:hypothetical protein